MLARLQSLGRIFFRRTEWEQELSDEIRFHIEQRAEDIQRSGVPRAQALRQARLEFGGKESCRESCREAHGAGWLDELARNLTYAARSMRKNPGFTAVAVISLALGIGANTAVFGFLRKLILEPLPGVRDPGALQFVTLSTPRGTGYRISYLMFEKLRDDFSVFSNVFAWEDQASELAAEGHSEMAAGALVSAGYFEGLGVRPLLGRFIAEADERSEAASHVVVLSYRAWQRLFSGDAGVLAGTLEIDGAPHTIIGIAPPEFGGAEPATAADFYVPLSHFFSTLRTDYLNLKAMVRLKSGVRPGAAQAELRARWPGLDSDRRARLGRRGRPDLLLLKDGSHGYSNVGNTYGPAVIALMALVAVVFLIGCANLATLLFVRGARRTGETSIRLALGASRAQIVRQWMTECLLLAAVGGVCSLAAAAWISRLLVYFLPEPDRLYFRFHLDATLLGVAAGLTLAAGFLFGMLPARGATRVSAEAVLREHARSLTAQRGRIAEWMLAAELAASLVLVAGAALFARTLWNLNTASGGFDRNVVYAIPAFYEAHWPRPNGGYATWRTGMNEIVAILRRSPHVASASIGVPPLTWGEAFDWVTVPGYVYAQDESNIVYTASGTPGYFQTLSIPLLAGREFEERDIAGAPPSTSIPQSAIGGRAPRPIIVSESFARHYFKGRNPLGAVVTLTSRKAPQQIVGVVKNVKHLGLRQPDLDVVYTPIGPNGMANLLVRARPGVDPAIVEGDVRAAIRTVLKVDVPSKIAALEDEHQKSLRRDRLVADLSAAFGLLGVLLASIGLYGAMAHVVASRTREIGARMALGANHWQIMRMVFVRSLGVTALGILLGWPLAFAASKAVASLLFGVAPGDPVTLATAGAVLAMAGLLAAWWPARRAARIDPMQALRYE